MQGDDMRAELEEIESNVALREETNFVGRVNALDRIELLNANALDLKERAEILVEQFAEIDRAIYQRFRVGIANGSLRGESVRKEIDRYVCKPAPSQRGYDALDVFVNGLLRLDTLPRETRPRESEMVPYQPTPVRVILELIEMLSIAPQDIFYDVGSGLGQVCLLVNILTGARTRGIEFEPAYVDYACQSAHRLNLPRVEFVNVDAREADYGDGNIFFLYTPFKGTMMTKVLQKIESASRGRYIRLGAYGECVDQVASEEWLELVAKYRDNSDALAVFKRSEL